MAALATRVRDLGSKLRGGVDIKGRMYRLKTFPDTFLGTDAVAFLMRSENVAEKEALKLGNLLIREKVFHHVCDDHLLENKALFYRFYRDEPDTAGHAADAETKRRTATPTAQAAYAAKSKTSPAPTQTTQQQLVAFRLSMDRELANGEAEREDLRLRFEGQLLEQERSIRALLRVVLALGAIVACLSAATVFGRPPTTWLGRAGDVLALACVLYGLSIAREGVQAVAARHGVHSLLSFMVGGSLGTTTTLSSTTTAAAAAAAARPHAVNGATSASSRAATASKTSATPLGSPASTGSRRRGNVTTSSKSSVDNSVELIPSSYDVSKLLSEHATQIKKLQELVPPLPEDVDPHLKKDDLFYLRYILSFGTAEKARSALEFAYKFRSTDKFQTLTRHIADGRFEQLPGVKEAKKWQVGVALDDVLTRETGGGVAVLIRMSMCNLSMMHDRISKADIYDMNLGQREGCYQLCDKLTRETGMLCKQTMFMDMHGASLSSMADRRQGNAHAEISKLSSRLYPQLMDKFCILNAPSWMGWLMSVYKTIASKRSIAKFELFTSTDQLWSSEWARKRLKRRHFPAFVGGGVPVERLSGELRGELVHVGPLPQITVGARSKETVSIDIVGGGEGETNASAKIAFCFHIVSKSIEYSATFVPSDGTGGGSGDAGGGAAAVPVVLAAEGQKLKAELGPVRGEWVIEGGRTGGTVLVEFDNTSSTLRSKTVVYSFDVDDV